MDEVHIQDDHQTTLEVERRPLSSASKDYENSS